MVGQIRQCIPSVLKKAAAMRLWTVHPKYLDAKGLVALWREGLLAKAVLDNQTKGYRHHPQLIRFRRHEAPRAALAAYLGFVLAESRRRGYHFDATKLPRTRSAVASIEETQGQLVYEWRHLLKKLKDRDPVLFRRWSAIRHPEPHPSFKIVPGGIRSWERRKECVE